MYKDGETQFKDGIVQLTEKELAQYKLDTEYQKREEIAITGPFVTDTNAWVKLGLKIALREAVSRGADKIVWANSEQQYLRWQSDKFIWKKIMTGFLTLHI